MARVVAQAGLVTPPGETKAFVATIERLASDGALRSRLGRQVCEYAEIHMGQERILASFEQDLHALVQTD